MNSENNSSKKKSKAKKYIPLLFVIIIIIGVGIYWFYEYSKYIKTDDAYIDTDNISVSSKMLGRIIKTYAEEGDSVYEGQLLAELDSSSLYAQKQHAITVEKQAESNLVQVQAQYQYNVENIKVFEVNLDKSKSDLERAKKQFEGGVIPKEQYDHIKIAYDVARARLNASKTELKVSKAHIDAAKATIESARAEIGVIETQLTNTKLYAPISGIVAKKWLLPGDIVQPSQSVFTVTNNHKLWVTVFLQETKIANVYIHQKALFTIDAFPGITFTGKVFSIGSNTASQFSLIPPNNASGNFTKITQRIPVKISIDKPLNNKKHQSYKLIAGMSVVVKIIKSE